MWFTPLQLNSLKDLLIDSPMSPVHDPKVPSEHPPTHAAGEALTLYVARK